MHDKKNGLQKPLLDMASREAGNGTFSIPISRTTNIRRQKIILFGRQFPLELIAYFCSFLLPKDLLKLRLASRLMHDVVTNSDSPLVTDENRTPVLVYFFLTHCRIVGGNKKLMLWDNDDMQLLLPTVKKQNSSVTQSWTELQKISRPTLWSAFKQDKKFIISAILTGLQIFCMMFLARNIQSEQAISTDPAVVGAPALGTECCVDSCWWELCKGITCSALLSNNSQALKWLMSVVGNFTNFEKQYTFFSEECQKFSNTTNCDSLNSSLPASRTLKDGLTLFCVSDNPNTVFIVIALAITLVITIGFLLSSVNRNVSDITMLLTNIKKRTDLFPMYTKTYKQFVELCNRKHGPADARKTEVRPASSSAADDGDERKASITVNP